jgi:hypothetical protein
LLEGIREWGIMSAFKMWGGGPMLRAAACGFAAFLLVGGIPSVAQERVRSDGAVLRPTLPLEVKTEVRSERAQFGDEVKFKTMQGSIFNGTVIPKSSEVFGKVIRVQAREDGVPAKLCVRLERATWKEGEVHLKGYVTAEMVFRIVTFEGYGVKREVHQFGRKMPDLKLLRSEDGTTTLLRERNNVVLKRGMTMVGEISDVSSIEARR